MSGLCPDVSEEVKARHVAGTCSGGEAEQDQVERAAEGRPGQAF